MKFFILFIATIFSMSPHTIFNFTSEADIQNWRVVNDGVMGGLSSATFLLNTEGHGVFSGKVSLENNGGFSSLRYPFDRTEVADYTEVVIKLLGDKKTYQFRLKSKSSDYYSYITLFDTSGEWQEVTIPLADLYPQFRGRKLNLPNFDNDYIEEIGFLIGNKKAENFELVIDKIELR